MANKKCMIFETLGKVSDLQVQESQSKNDGMRLSGVFGVCGVKNNNNRVYDKQNYAQMVEGLQKVIATEGCPGELEHPNTMNINLENVSHKIESIEMNEDGTITGTILLLNTPKGKIAQAIVEGGLPLYISSRGAGTITNEGRVNLTTLKTYDLVGTPGFSQAKLNLKENQTVECLNESLDEGNMMWAIVDESADESAVEEGLLDGAPSGDKSDEKKPDNTLDIKAKKSDDEEKSTDEKEEKKSEEDKGSKESCDTKDCKKEDNNKKDKVTMNELKDAIDKLVDKVSTLEAQLHIAQESLNPVNYDAVEKWITEEFAPEFKKEIKSDVESGLKNWSVNELAPKIQNWITEEYSPEIQRWITEEYSNALETWISEEYGGEVRRWVNEEFAPNIEKWITEEYTPEMKKWITEDYSAILENWITEEYSPVVQNWITEEYSPVIQNWITEEYSPVVEGWINEEFSTTFENKINENISEYLNENNISRLDEIDSLLESISDNNKEVQNVIKETRSNDRYAGVFCVENMPDQYRPSWNMISETKQDEIVRSSKLYDFTKPGVLESFWSNVKFEDEPKKIAEESKDVTSDYHNAIFEQMMRLRR